jgi:hypothetical protein
LPHPAKLINPGEDMRKLKNDFDPLARKVDQESLAAQLNALRPAFAANVRNWRAAEVTVPRIKLDGVLRKQEEDFVVSLMRQTVSDALRSLRLSGRLMKEVAVDTGVLQFVIDHQESLSNDVTLRGLPPYDAAELRASGLDDRTVLTLLLDGIRTYRSQDVAHTAQLCARKFATLSKAIKPLMEADANAWRRDIVHGNSWWEAGWDAVKIVAGAVIVGANLAGATTTVGSTLISVASGAGLIADGARDLDRDIDDAMGIPSN